MGFDINGTKLLFKAKQAGVSFKKVVMIGRQGLHLSANDLKRNFRENGYTNIDAGEILKSKGGYAEPLLQALGAEVTDSIDASDYENATIVHDMNKELPEVLKLKYTTIIDGGSLEHIFNFPVAIKNCMELIEEKGHYLGLTPCNNFLGHGFYQFSPELYFRIFSESNGFKIIKILFFSNSNFENDPTGSQLYEVKDPFEVNQRIELSNCHPSYLFVIAQKVAIKNIFSEYPQQSDYENLAWKGQSDSSQVVTIPKKPSQIINLIKKIPLSLKTKLLSMLIPHYYTPIGRGNKSFFRPVK